MTVMMVERELQIIKSWLLIETELVTILKVCCLLTQHMMDIRVDNFKVWIHTPNFHIFVKLWKTKLSRTTQ